MPTYAPEALATYDEVQASSCDCTDRTQVEIEELIDLASDILVLAAGKVLGRATTTLRPCSDSCSCGSVSCDACWCCRLDQIRIPGINPSITSVKIDGSALDSSEYKLMDGEWLVRISTGDRPASWPGCQSLWRPDTEDDTFSIGVTHGIANNQLIRAAATEVTCYLLGDDTRSRTTFDPRASTVTQGGVTITLDDLAARLKRGDLALPKVMRMLSVYSPNGRTPASVWSPELDGDYELHTFS